MKLESVMLVAEYGDFLMQEHVLMNHQLGSLIDQDHQQRQEKVFIYFHLQ
jgi:hypothetical protein